MEQLSWDRIEEAFSLAADMPEGERQAFLRSQYPQEDILIKKVEDLLIADDAASGFLSGAPMLPQAMADVFYTERPSQTTLIGKQIGSYEIIGYIGEGGMGSVHLAERSDGEFEKQVAIKLIKREIVADLNLRRFRRERQILAGLEHPNIARLLDGGTTDDGIPYLIMELVKGRPLLDFCRANELDTDTRIKLFLQVCDAVSHAHKRGIIHRDIKPSNILVDDLGMPKLLDFGIAKMSDPGRDRANAATTAAPAMQMTPEYASPEQVRGALITPASDIYSLGIVLHEMLTGKRPYSLGSRSVYEIARVVCDEPVYRVENVSAAVESVILRCLNKEPADRFPDVCSLAGALRRAIKPAANGNAERLQNDVSSISVPTLAVRPFRILTIDGKLQDAPERGYLGIGLADALTTRFAGFREINVVPTSSVVAAERSEPTSFDMASGLKAEYLIEGTIMSDGVRFRVTTHLLEIRTERLLAAERFELAETDIFRLQDLIAEKTIDALLPQLPIRNVTPINGTTTSGMAYEAYLHGRYYWHTYTFEGIARSEHFFNEAIGHDPNFALAYAGLADFYNWAGVAESTPSAPLFQAAKKAAQKAISLQPDLAEALSALAFTTWAYDWDNEKAERLYRRSLDANPNYANTYEWYGYLLTTEKRFEEARSSMEKGRQLNGGAGVAVMASYCAYLARRYGEAYELNAAVIDAEPRYYLALQGMGWVCPPLGKFDEGISACRKALEISDSIGFNKLSLALILAESGETEEARKLLDELLEKDRTSHIPAYFFGLLYAVLGDIELSLNHLEQAVKDRGYWTQWMRVEPRLDRLRGIVRFEELLTKIAPLEMLAANTSEFVPGESATGEVAAETLSVPKTRKSGHIAVAAALLLASVFALAALFLGDRPSGDAAAQPPPRSNGVRTVAIQTFTDHSSSGLKGQGIAEELRNQLGRFRSIAVIKAESAGRKDINEAEYVLSGSINEMGERQQLSLELSRSDFGELIWKDKFAANVNDLPMLSSRVMERLLNILAVEADGRDMTRQYTQNAAAYESYLEGRHYLQMRTSDGFGKARKSFETALESDPQFALAYAGLADTYILIASYAEPVPPGVLIKAETNALKALAIDEQLAEAHASYAMVRSFENREDDSVETHFRRSIELNPSYPQARHWYGFFLMNEGRNEEALEQLTRAAYLEPYSSVIQTNLAVIHGKMEQGKEALAIFEKAIELDPNSAHPYMAKSMQQQAAGDYEGAVATMRRLENLHTTPENAAILEIMEAQLAAHRGERSSANEKLEKFFAQKVVKQASASFAADIAVTYLLLGDREKALSWLEKIKSPVRRKDAYNDPRLASLAGEPRFDALDTAGRSELTFLEFDLKTNGIPFPVVRLSVQSLYI